MSMYNKANKATLGELNKQHEIVKLLSTSLNKSHAKGVEVTKKLGLPLKVSRTLKLTLLNDISTFI